MKLLEEGDWFKQQEYDQKLQFKLQQFDNQILIPAWFRYGDIFIRVLYIVLFISLIFNIPRTWKNYMACFLALIISISIYTLVKPVLETKVAKTGKDLIRNNKTRGSSNTEKENS